MGQRVMGCCWNCIEGAPDYWERYPLGYPFLLVCSLCGNKRCPHATDHRQACTRSNATGQKGSRYE
jgi:hypothetical protein